MNEPLIIKDIKYSVYRKREKSNLIIFHTGSIQTFLRLEELYNTLSLSLSLPPPLSLSISFSNAKLAQASEIKKEREKKTKLRNFDMQFYLK